jgi:hypothetical protein
MSVTVPSIEPDVTSCAVAVCVKNTKLAAAKNGRIPRAIVGRDAEQRLRPQVPAERAGHRVEVPRPEAARLQREAKSSLARAELELGELGAVPGVLGYFVETRVLERGCGVFRGDDRELLGARVERPGPIVDEDERAVDVAELREDRHGEEAPDAARLLRGDDLADVAVAHDTSSLEGRCDEQRVAIEREARLAHGTGGRDPGRPAKVEVERTATRMGERADLVDESLRDLSEIEVLADGGVDAHDRFDGLGDRRVGRRVGRCRGEQALAQPSR